MNKADSNKSPKDISNDEHTEFVKTNSPSPVMQPSFVNNMYINTSQEDLSNDGHTVAGAVEASSQPRVMQLFFVNNMGGNTSQEVSNEDMIWDKLGRIISKTVVDDKVIKLCQKCKVTSRKITQTLPKASKRAKITLSNFRIKTSPAQHQKNLALAQKNRELLEKRRLASKAPVLDMKTTQNNH